MNLSAGIIKLTVIAIFGVILIAASQSIANTKANVDGEKEIMREEVINYNNGKYRNKNKWEHPGIKESLTIAWDFLFKGGKTKPGCSLPFKQIDFSMVNTLEENQLNSTWLGHSSLMIHIDGYKLLLDPVFGKRISIVGPTRFNGDVPMDVKQIPEVDVVIISHNHYDHLNKFSIKLLKDKAGVFLVPTGIGKILKRWGVDGEKIIELNWWEEFYINDDFMIAATPSQHFSGRGLLDRNKTLWASWVISGAEHKIFFSGDSGYFDGFKEIGEKYGPFDITYLECGAYDDQWKQVHMFPKQTVKAHEDLRGSLLHPIHWGTFDLALHSWYDPMERLVAASDRKNIKIVTPVPGESFVYGEEIKTVRWWETIKKK